MFLQLIIHSTGDVTMETHILKEFAKMFTMTDSSTSSDYKDSLTEFAQHTIRFIKFWEALKGCNRTPSFDHIPMIALSNRGGISRISRLDILRSKHSPQFGLLLSAEGSGDVVFSGEECSMNLACPCCPPFSVSVKKSYDDPIRDALCSAMEGFDMKLIIAGKRVVKIDPISRTFVEVGFVSLQRTLFPGLYQCHQPPCPAVIKTPFDEIEFLQPSS